MKRRVDGPSDRKVCCCIMLCQMIAILSGVAIMYLTVIVVSPSKRELSLGIKMDPIMCTTVEAEDITSGGKKVECEWSTCGEWCLSKSSKPCMQIYAMPRLKGSRVQLQDCEIFTQQNCSALDVSKTTLKLCKMGECKGMTGLFNCSKVDENPCREFSAAYKCTKGKLNKETIACDEYKCSMRLDGVYTCLDGQCNRVDGINTYLDCERKCEDLDLTRGNTVIFSQDTILNAHCNAVNSTGNDTMNSLNVNNQWKGRVEALLMFCSEVKQIPDVNGKVTINTDDCFNATLKNGKTVSSIKSYVELIQYHTNSPAASTRWLIDPEESLRFMNNTVLKINSEGCVNTLMKECDKFFQTHSTDGRDGRTANRYPCYYTPLTKEFVLGKFNENQTYTYLMIASSLPGSLFIFSCCCLFICSKSVRVDETGRLKVALCGQREGKVRIGMEL